MRALPGTRTTLAAAGLVLIAGFQLSACEREPPTAQQDSSSADWEPRFARLPDELARLVWAHEDYLGHLQMTPVAEPAKGETVAALKTALDEAQPQVALALQAAAELAGPIPTFEWATEDEVASGAHLDRARARVQNTARLLQADAVRFWEAGDDRAAWSRLLANVRIARAFTGDDDQQHQLLGLTVFATTLFTAEGMVRERSPAWRGDESSEFLASIERLQARRTTTTPELQRALSSVRAALGG